MKLPQDIIERGLLIHDAIFELVIEDLEAGVGEYRARNTGQQLIARIREKISKQTGVIELWEIERRGDASRYRAIYTHLRALLDTHGNDRKAIQKHGHQNR